MFYNNNVSDWGLGVAGRKDILEIIRDMLIEVLFKF